MFGEWLWMPKWGKTECHQSSIFLGLLSHRISGVSAENLSRAMGQVLGRRKACRELWSVLEKGYFFLLPRSWLSCALGSGC